MSLSIENFGGHLGMQPMQVEAGIRPDIVANDEQVALFGFVAAVRAAGDGAITGTPIMSNQPVAANGTRCGEASH